ncbi:hypothetical protein [Salinicoccus kekensis]|uniref:Uncharacterized protein n=1 Tax=Salinicoccus kekensis TaxID=714307 RepID=A0A285UTA4_9STAP|nr:hypothetical protein [Salinicoccus kekensis]SOC45094.1 hypothetical protein SAMN05878391_2600 [Salinicoccus kekensis]
MRISHDYTDLLSKFLLDLNNTEIVDDEYVYVTRGAEQSIYDITTNDVVRYKPVISYHLYLDKIEEDISYERIKVIHLMDELVTVNNWR